MELYIVQALLVGRVQIGPNICRDDYLTPDQKIESLIYYCPEHIEYEKPTFSEL